MDVVACNTLLLVELSSLTHYHTQMIRGLYIRSISPKDWEQSLSGGQPQEPSVMVEFNQVSLLSRYCMYRNTSCGHEGLFPKRCFSHVMGI